MRIKWMKYKNGRVDTRDITQAVKSVSWSGSVSQAARAAEIAVVNAPNDKNIKNLKLNIGAGQIIKLYEDGELIFLAECRMPEK